MGKRPAVLLPLLLVSQAPDLDIIVSHALNGQVAANRCDGVRQAQAVRLAEQLSPATKALRLDSGDLLGTSSMGRLAIEDDPVGFARAVEHLGLQGAAIGHRDLAAPRARLLQFLRTVRLRFTLTNLACEDDELCALVTNADDAPHIIDTPYGKVAFIAAISPTALEHAARDRTRSIALLPPAQALSEATRRARESGAKWVVASYDPALGRELEDAVAETLKLDPGASPDVMFVAGINDQVRTAVTALASTLLVATRPDEAVRVQWVGPEQEVTLAAHGQAPPALVRYAEALNDKLCRRFAQPLAGGALSAPMSRDDFAAYLLDVLREEARADVGIINRLAISRRAPYPFSGTLTPLALMQALPFENELRVTTLRGEELEKFFLDSRLFYVRGVRQTADGLFVNGRPLDRTGDYRIVTIDFVAEGGHGAFPPRIQQRFRPFGERTMRDLVLQRLAVKRADPVDPSERTRWTLMYKAQLDLTSVNVVNPRTDIFTDTQLARGQALSLVGETEFRVFGDHPAATYENQARLRYGLSRTVARDGTDSGLNNNIDVLLGRSLLFYRRLFSQHPSWYQPRPYADLYIESELTRPVDRAFHHLQLLPTAGLRFELTRTLAIYGGIGVTWETLARRDQLTPPQDPAAFVVVAGWQLRPTKLVQLGEKNVEAETNLDLFVRDIGQATQMQARARVRLIIPVFSILALTATYDMFLRYLRFFAGAGGYQPVVGYSGDVYVGLQLTFSHATQAFAF